MSAGTPVPSAQLLRDAVAELYGEWDKQVR